MVGEAPELARVSRYIRENECKGIDVADLVGFSTLYRRQLERRFRQYIDKTPREENTAVQVWRIKQLLKETELPLERIAPLAGYNHTESMAMIFKRETGETPGGYRRRHHRDTR